MIAAGYASAPVSSGTVHQRQHDCWAWLHIGCQHAAALHSAERCLQRGQLSSVDPGTLLQVVLSLRTILLRPQHVLPLLLLLLHYA
jgi:hypothetical protein